MKQFQIQPSSDWLPSLGLLARLHTPTSVVQVGSQPAAALSRHWLQQWKEWGVAHALLVDPLSAPLASDGETSGHPAGWHTSNALLGAQTQESASFYTLSLRVESGLLAAGEMRALWPNIQETSAHERPVTTLQDLLETLPSKPPAPDWILVESLPALPVLQGAAQLLRTSTHVVCARVVLPPAGHPHQPVPPLCDLPATQAYLEAEGFMAVALVETRHPQLALAVFVRNLASEIVKKNEQLDEAQQAIQS